MTDRDIMEQILELYDEAEKLKQMITNMFNRVYADHLRKEKEKDND